MQNSVRTLHLGCHWVLQQDNDLKHTSKKVLPYFKDTNTNVVEWPAQSPDLNPIENLWQVLKKNVHARKPCKYGPVGTVCNEGMGQNSSVNLCQPSEKLFKEVAVSCGSKRVQNWLLMVRGLIILTVSLLLFLVETDCDNKIFKWNLLDNVSVAHLFQE